MKKFIAIAAVAISLTACNSSKTEETPVTTDTVTVKADTTMVIIDSTVLDSSKAAE